MPEDPLVHGEIAALTRRYENALQIVRGDIAAVDNRLMGVEEKLGGLDQKVDAFIAEQRAANARLVEMLAALATRDAS